MSGALPILIGGPFAAAMVSFLFTGAIGRALSVLLATASAVAALATSIEVMRSGVQIHALAGWGAPLGIELRIDGLAMLMLLLTAGISLAVTTFAAGYLKGDAQPHFWPLWYFLWGALNTVFLVSDIFSLYVCLELITLAAVGGTALSGDRIALSASLRYLMSAIMGSLAYLLGVAMIYAQVGTLDLTQLSGRLGSSWSSGAALSLVTAGLAMKTALFPLHFWLPAAHSLAPAPISAALSAMVVKASFYVLLRFWFQLSEPTSNQLAAHLLGALGMAAVLWGSVQAALQERLKLVVAYSTVAQIGYLFFIFPLFGGALAAGRSEWAQEAWKGGIILILAHAVAKSAMFLVSGALLQTFGSDRISDLKGAAVRAPLTLAAWGIAGISLIGLPPSGGFIAKWLLLTTAIRQEYWLYVAVLLLGGLLASVYVFRVLWHSFLTPEEMPSVSRIPGSMSISILALTVVLLLMGLRPAIPLEFTLIGIPLPAGDLR
ncbi:MAG: hypothetical protein A2428_01920 [Bdellovibrionales bacterium RIFOXYC1_FULL_54_43]|nr:MAG: hypothetical protein A2428_01920 [Bdellovibrionales bacterium RIFOXYC1_FULL_54_43]OFZ81696.1 MAG: hypothetical protein A2603_12130 [Bdellovibrionales bacterium RIFOXYD1_FULL_55_31]